ncbi:MAG: sulfite exporter TauE/SafE family protein, partial [Deltaproteobacteria bacterium]|nr:sulfite exporter TauE/SafE family protein [Deltaproteobacteria bacterium]
ARRTAGSTLRTAFGALLVVVSLQMLFFHPKPRPGEPPLPAWALFLLIGLLSGAVSFFFGVGGGIAAVPLLVSLGRLPIHQAVGTSSPLIVFLAIYGTIRNVLLGQQEAVLPPHSWGYVNLLAAACLMPTSILMARVGANLANVASATLLRRLFAALVGIEGVRMALL